MFTGEDGATSESAGAPVSVGIYFHLSPYDSSQAEPPAGVQSYLWLDTQVLEVFVHGLHSVAHLFELCFQMADLCHFLGELLELFLNDLVVVIIKLIQPLL